MAQFVTTKGFQADFQAIYQKNLTALSNIEPDLAARVAACPLTGKYRMAPSKGKVPVPNIKIVDKGVFYYDETDPFSEVNKELRSLNLKNAQIAIFFGFGLGYQGHIFGNQWVNKANNRFMLFFEPDLELFKAALTYNDMAPLITHPNVKLIVGVQPEDLYAILYNYLLEHNRYLLLRAVKIVHHKTALLLNRDYYQQAYKSLQEAALQVILLFGNSPQDSLVGVANALANLKIILENPGINLLYDKFKGKPAIVVATGPSLNKNKHLLKGLEHRALIVSADASLKILMEMGVKPHLVTALERVPEVVKLIDGFTAEDLAEVYFAACPIILPEVYAAYPGPKIMVYRNFNHFKWLETDKGILNIGPSAGNMAFKVAEALGCDPIILIGQDLAYGREGTSHAQGTPYGEHQLTEDDNDILEVPGNDGLPVKTNSTWLQFLKHYRIDLETYQGACLNCTEGGAYIQGARVMTFQSAIDHYLQEEFDPRRVIRVNLNSFITGKIKDDWAKVYGIITETRRAMTDLLSSCQEGTALVKQAEPELSRIIDKYKEIKPRKLEKKLQAWESKIYGLRLKCIHAHPSYELFFMHIAQSYIINFDMETNMIPEKYDDLLPARAAILLRYQEWFKTISELGLMSIEPLDRAILDL